MDDLDSVLRAREQERCDAIVAQDWERLGALLSSSLIHTHTRGNTDTRDSYLKYVGGPVEILSVRREDLRIVALGIDAAVMHGRQINRARLRGKADDGELTIESIVLQAWVREGDGQWRLAAFQATSLGPPPPPVNR